MSDGHEVFVVCETEAEVERLGELFKRKARTVGQLAGGSNASRLDG